MQIRSVTDQIRLRDIILVLAAFAVCKFLHLNPFDIGSDSIHADAQSVKFTPKTIAVPMPKATKTDVKGTDLTAEQKEVLYRSRRTKKPKAPGMLIENNMADIPGTLDAIRNTPVIDVDPCPDMSFGFNDSARWIDTTKYITPAGEPMTYVDSGFYYFRGISDCFNRGLPLIAIWSSDRHPLVFFKETTNTVLQRPWLRVSPFVEVNALDRSDWRYGIKLSLRVWNIWAYGAVQMPIVRDPDLRTPVGIEYDVFTIE